MRRLSKYLTLFLIGEVIYFEVELNWRYFTCHLPVHWTMPLLGAFLFVLIGGLNNWFEWETSLVLQAAVGMLICTVAEFIAGCILNLWLCLDVWDYSMMPFNVCGQICLPFMAVWLCLSAVAIVLDDWLRYLLFGEKKPEYRLF